MLLRQPDRKLIGKKKKIQKKRVHSSRKSDEAARVKNIVMRRASNYTATLNSTFFFWFVPIHLNIIDWPSHFLCLLSFESMTPPFRETAIIRARHISHSSPKKCVLSSRFPSKATWYTITTSRHFVTPWPVRGNNLTSSNMEFQGGGTYIIQ